MSGVFWGFFFLLTLKSLSSICRRSQRWNSSMQRVSHFDSSLGAWSWRVNMVLCELIADLFACLLTPTCNASGSVETNSLEDRRVLSCSSSSSSSSRAVETVRYCTHIHSCENRDARVSVDMHDASHFVECDQNISSSYRWRWSGTVCSSRVGFYL